VTSTTSGIREIPAQDWLRELRSTPSPDAISLIVSASMEFTERCNLRCAHCYINQPAGDEAIRARELSIKEWDRILGEMADSGLLWLLVTGGECLLRPDFPEFYVSAKKRGLHITVFTNGTLLTPEIADLFVEYPPWNVEITLYGATEQTYECVTRVPGSYARCLQGIRLLLDRGVALALKMTVLDLNEAELQAVEQLAATFGTKFRSDAVLFSRLDGDHRGIAHRLTPEQIVALESSDDRRLQGWEKECSKSLEGADRGRLFLCGAGRRTYHVSAYGDLSPCMLARWARYDLRHNPLSDALKEFLPRVVGQMRTRRGTPCETCEWMQLCPGCPGWAYCETGDPEMPGEFPCRVAQLRYQVLESRA